MKFRMLERVSFRKSVMTNYDELIEAHPRLHLADDEVVALLSLKADHLVFVYGYMDLKAGDRKATVLRSRSLRLTEGEWDVEMLKEYAKRANMKITDWSVLDKAFKKASEQILTAFKKAASRR